jgi:hypothetical protein
LKPSHQARGFNLILLPFHSFYLARYPYGIPCKVSLHMNLSAYEGEMEGGKSGRARE